MTKRAGTTIYFIRPKGAKGPVKIGMSDHPERRLYDIQSFSPLALEIAAMVDGSSAVERGLHNHFQKHRLHGEWFAEHDALNSLIDDIIEGGVELRVHRERVQSPFKLAPNPVISGLSKHQLKVLIYIMGFTASDGRAPTYREIANGVGEHVNGIARTVQKLVRHGALVMRDND